MLFVFYTAENAYIKNAINSPTANPLKYYCKSDLSVIAV